MPRTKLPQVHQVEHLDFDPSTPLKLRRALYTRLSDRDDDPESVSHEEQERQDRAYCERNGYVITAVYRDWRTGTDPKRLAFRQMATDAHTGLHGGVVFRVPDRLYRGITGVQPVLSLHQQLPGYSFEAAVGGFDISQVEMWAAMSGHELRSIRERTMAQSRFRASNGQLMQGKKPYWLDRDPVSKRAVVVAERADALLEALDLYMAGVPARAVAKWMTEHAPVRGGSRVWSSHRLKEAFRNPALWGKLDYGRSLEVKELRADGELIVLRREVNPDAIPFRVPALVHETALERTECLTSGGCERDGHASGDEIDAAISRNRWVTSGRPYKETSIDHPLRRRVVCPCGWRMNFRQRRRDGQDYDYGYLACARTHQAGASVSKDYPRCPLTSVPTRRLWPQVRELFVQAISDPEQVVRSVQAAILSEAIEQERSQASEAAELDRLSARLASLDAEEIALYREWKAEDISKVVYDAERSRIAAERMAAEYAKRLVLERRTAVERAEVATEWLKAALENLGRLTARVAFERLPLSEQAELFRSVVADVVLDAEGRPTLRWQQAQPEPGLSRAS